MTANELPIGVFDSGVGGLTVAAALLEHLPAESILYLGDTARLPYGTKSPETVARYTRRNLDFLLGRGVKAVVVACNTASALALDRIEASVPVWGVVEPGASAAARVARGPIGVLATESTIRSGAYEAAIRRRRGDLEVIPQACPLFVPLVEEGWADDPITEEIARRYLEPLLDRGAEALVLGCTHYPVLKPVLQRVAGDAVSLVDSAETVAALVAVELAAAGLLRVTAPGGPRVELCVTDAGERFQRIADQILRDGAPPLEWVEV
ncbi:MAG: glutamate racemase [Acidobacteriota bacterium]